MGALVVVGAVVLGVVGLVAWLLAATAWGAWWMYPAWEWFVVPLGLPRISLWHFAGLGLLARAYFTYRGDSHRKDERPVDWVGMGTGYLLPPMVWAILRWLHQT